MDIREKYVHLLRIELLQGQQDIHSFVSDEGKKKLRDFRNAHHISSSFHIQALRSLGWSLDQYEAGNQDLSAVRKPIMIAANLPPHYEAADSASTSAHDIASVEQRADKAKSVPAWLQHTPVLHWVYRRVYNHSNNSTSSVGENPPQQQLA